MVIELKSWLSVMYKLFNIVVTWKKETAVEMIDTSRGYKSSMCSTMKCLRKKVEQQFNPFTSRFRLGLFQLRTLAHSFWQIEV